MRTVAIDFETANARPDSACAVGFAWIEGDRVVRREHHLIRPREMRFDAGNIRVHGIHPEHVEDAPEFDAVMADFVAAMGDALLVAHNASFDMRVLEASARAYRMALPRHASLCTVALGRRLWPDATNHKLSTLAHRCGVSFRHHHAGEDAFACATIALTGMAEEGASSVRDLAARTGLARARTGVVALRAGGIAERALGELRPARPRPVAIAAPDPASLGERRRFTVSGSAGTAYDVVLTREPAGWRSRCTCMSARFRPVCKHAAALMAGDFRAVVAENRPEGAAEIRVFPLAEIG